jgi:class 3 adenylate cyclase
MESHGVAGCIQVTERTYQRLRDGYRFQRRGPIQVRGVGEMVTYFLVGGTDDRPSACDRRNHAPPGYRASSTVGK